MIKVWAITKRAKTSQTTSYLICVVHGQTNTFATLELKHQQFLLSRDLHKLQATVPKRAMTIGTASCFFCVVHS